MRRRKNDAELRPALRIETFISPCRLILLTNDQKDEGRCSTTVLVDVAIVSERAQILDDEESDHARDVVLELQELAAVLEAKEAPAETNGGVDDAHEHVELLLVSL
jgi:hypothetical protein